jgi:SAM-dependent methyltransferase
VTTPPALPLTGERTVPGVWPENYWFRRHEAAYRLWAPACTSARVLEAGCGEGYGAAQLSAAGAATVLGLDLDEATLRHAVATYTGVGAARANLVALPVADRSVDVVVCSQTLEHLWEQERFLGECARVLRHGGRLLLSTPNRRTFPPGNVFHHRELDADELRDLVTARFARARLTGIAHGPRLAAWESAYGDLVARQIATDPHAWDDDLATAVRSVTAADFVVTEDLDGCLDLLVDAT